MLANLYGYFVLLFLAGLFFLTVELLYIAMKKLGVVDEWAAKDQHTKKNPLPNDTEQ